MDEFNDGYIKDKVLGNFSSYQHPPYILEKKLILSIQQMDEISSITILNQINKLERAHLADTPQRSLKDSIIASCTLFTRAVIEVGVDSEIAFFSSDECIREIESLKTTKQLEEFEYSMLHKFIQMISKNSHPHYSHSVNKTISFIRKNVQHKITLQSLANEVSMHPNYLSSIFKREVGVSISSYIEKQKSDAILMFITETSLSLTDIAFTFEFSSVAYFSKYFKKNFGIPPLKYRQLHSEE